MTVWPIVAPEPTGPVKTRVVAPRFTVVVAAYQVADLIGDGIESILAQSTPPFEIIVVDDGSSDGLESTVRRFGDRVAYLRQPHRGAAAAMNTGIDAASGDYVVFIGADDVFSPRRLEALTALAVSRPDLDILTTDAYVAVGNTPFRRFYDETNPFVSEDQRAEILERNFVFGHATALRQRLVEIGGFDESIRWTSDWELWIRMILGGSRIGLVNEPLATYRLWERSLSSQRLNQSRGKVMTLGRTILSPALTDAEREVVRRNLARCRRDVTAGEAELALVEGTPGARGRALAIARDSRFPPKTRVKAFAAALLPHLAASLLRRGQRESWVGAGGVRIRREAAGDPPPSEGQGRQPG